MTLCNAPPRFDQALPLDEFPHMYNNVIGIGICRHIWFNIESMTATGMPPQMSVQGGVRGGSMGIQHWLYPHERHGPNKLMSRSGESNSTDEAIRTAKRTLHLTTGKNSQESLGPRAKYVNVPRNYKVILIRGCFSVTTVTGYRQEEIYQFSQTPPLRLSDVRMIYHSSRS